MTSVFCPKLNNNHDMHHAMYIYSPCHHVELVRLLEIKYRNHYIVSFLFKNNITL